MVYKCTLLKDTLLFPAGTVFTAKERGQYYECYEHNCLAFLVDDPVWVKREVYLEKSQDLKCPECGETKGFMSLNFHRNGYDNIVVIRFKYVCGHIRLW